MERFTRAIHGFTWILIGILTIILIYSTAEFLTLVIRSMLNRTAAFDFSQQAVDKENLFLVQVQGMIAGILMITIIIELIYSLLASLDKKKRNTYLLVLFEIGAIAVIRHLFVYDMEHVSGVNLIGIALLLLVLGVFNILFRPEFLQKITQRNSHKETNNN